MHRSRQLDGRYTLARHRRVSLHTVVSSGRPQPIRGLTGRLTFADVGDHGAQLRTQTPALSPDERRRESGLAKRVAGVTNTCTSMTIWWMRASCRRAGAIESGPLERMLRSTSIRASDASMSYMGDSTFLPCASAAGAPERWLAVSATYSLPAGSTVIPRAVASRPPVPGGQ